MRHWLSPAVLGIRVIAKQFGVSPMTVQNVARKHPSIYPACHRPGRANPGHDQRHVLGDLHLDQCRFRSQCAPLDVGSPRFSGPQHHRVCEAILGDLRIARRQGVRGVVLEIFSRDQQVMGLLLPVRGAS